MIVTAFIVFLVSVLGGLLLIAGYITIQGDEDFRIFPAEKGPVKCEYIDEEKAVFSCTLTYRNTGKQLAMVLDIFPRLLLPREQFDIARVSCRIEHPIDRRDDGYMQAFLSDAGDKGELVLVLEMQVKEGKKMEEILEDMVDITLNTYTISVGRTMPKTKKEFLTIDADDIKAAARKGADEKA